MKNLLLIFWIKFKWKIHKVIINKKLFFHFNIFLLNLFNISMKIYMQSKEIKLENFKR